MALDPALDDDARALADLGYTQELHRGMSGFSNFAVSFSIISVLSGCITTYYIGMDAGGPLAIVIGWPVVGFFVLCVALAMAEICSVFPTAGGLYFWAGRLAKRNKPAWAWFVGWFNFLGEVAVTAAIDFGAAITWMALLDLTFGFEVTTGRTFIAYLIILGLHGLLNTFGVNLVKLLSDVSAWWHVIGVGVIVAVLTFVPDQHQTVGWTFTHYENQTGWSNPIYVVAIGLLWRSTPTPATTPQPTWPRRPAAPPSRHPRASSTACSSASSPAGHCSSPSPGRFRTTQRSGPARPACRSPRSSSTRPAPRSASCCCSSAPSPSSSAAWRRSPPTRG
jgi:hypothetical protein